MAQLGRGRPQSPIVRDAVLRGVSDDGTGGYDGPAVLGALVLGTAYLGEIQPSAGPSLFPSVGSVTTARASVPTGVPALPVLARSTTDVVVSAVAPRATFAGPAQQRPPNAPPSIVRQSTESASPAAPPRAATCAAHWRTSPTSTARILSGPPVELATPLAPVTVTSPPRLEAASPATLRRSATDDTPITDALPPDALVAAPFTPAQIAPAARILSSTVDDSTQPQDVADAAPFDFTDAATTMARARWTTQRTALLVVAPTSTAAATPDTLPAVLAPAAPATGPLTAPAARLLQSRDLAVTPQPTLPVQMVLAAPMPPAAAAPPAAVAQVRSLTALQPSSNPASVQVAPIGRQAPVAPAPMVARPAADPGTVATVPALVLARALAIAVAPPAVTLTRSTAPQPTAPPRPITLAVLIARTVAVAAWLTRSPNDPTTPTVVRVPYATAGTRRGPSAMPESTTSTGTTAGNRRGPTITGA